MRENYTDLQGKVGEEMLEHLRGTYGNDSLQEVAISPSRNIGVLASMGLKHPRFDSDKRQEFGKLRTATQGETFYAEVQPSKTDPSRFVAATWTGISGSGQAVRAYTNDLDYARESQSTFKEHTVDNLLE